MKRLYTFPLPKREPANVFAAFAVRPFSLFFDSADRAHAQARHSIITFNPVETVTSSDDCFDGIRKRIAAQRFANNTSLPFTGGAAGMFGYDLAWTLERLPKISPNLPSVAIGIYDQAIVFDHASGEVTYAVHAEDERNARARNALIAAEISGEIAINDVEKTPLDWRSNFTRDRYERAVAAVIEYIRAGDIFQANLSQRFCTGLSAAFNPFSHYCTLRHINAAPFAAYMNFGEFQIASASPERFLKLDGRRLETRPIKGTSPRAHDPAALARSEKDCAENIMIVDLLRNDLSRVCTDRSITVPSLCRVESFARVHHLVSTIVGELRSNTDALGALQACFPGGSITGAPKIRAMEIIQELEGAARGPYCGALGYIDVSGRMDTSIAIRTLVYADGGVSFNVGGGITSASDPTMEYLETLDKAAGIFESFAA